MYTYMKKIAFIHEKFPAGGAERVTLDIVEYLHRNNTGYRSFLFVSEFDEELCTNAQKECFDVRVIPQGKGRAEAVEKLIVAEGIDLIVQVVYYLDGIKEIAERTGCKVLFANHGEPFWQRYSIIRKRKKRLLNRIFWHLGAEKKYVEKGRALAIAVQRTLEHYNSSDAYTVLCEDYRLTTCRAFGIKPEESRIYVIENSERVVENVTYDKEKIIMYCGRLENVSKRLDRLLRIWGKVQERMPDYKLVIVGDGEYRESMEKQIAMDGLQRVEMLGWQSSVESFFRKASVVCLTSQTEGWPLCLTEAQAHGCIPVAFGCSDGVKDVLSPSGINGFVVTPFDEDEYAETLLKIAEMNDDERRAIRESAVAKRAGYAPGIILKKWKDLFDSILDKK